LVKKNCPEDNFRTKEYWGLETAGENRRGGDEHPPLNVQRSTSNEKIAEIEIDLPTSDVE